MSLAKHGDNVKVHYTGRLDDGSVFDSSSDREPLQFTIGQQRLIPGFEEAIVGMNPGETKSVTIPAEQAFGPHRQEMVVVVERTKLPDGVPASVGQQLQLNQPGGNSVPARIAEVTASEVKLDANHPLAGKDLTFDLELVDIV